jgi:hypothetical protein
MAPAQNNNRPPPADRSDDDSAVSVLRHLEEERGKMFTESEYQEMRSSVLDELAHGARIRPFTLFTFGAVLTGLLALFVIGIVHASGAGAGDSMLAIVSGLALVGAAYFFWSCLRGIKLDTLRTLEARLAELEQLHQRRLVSADEYHRIQAHILIARQTLPHDRAHSSPS